MNDRYYIETDFGHGNNAGPKAKKDINLVLSKLGFKKICIKRYKNKYIRALMAKVTWHKALKNIYSSMIVIQYPLYSKRLEKGLVSEFSKKKRNNKFIIFVHDIESLRNEPDNRFKIKQEMHLINSFDYIVCHNQKMKQWLRANGITKTILSLQLFDYIAKDFPETLIDNKNALNYAGNLLKAQFLDKNFTTLPLYIFGTDIGSKINKNYVYKGNFSPEIVPSKILEGFGIVWDGTSALYPNGNAGNYLKYITPHKLSLYLRSGIPVIVWSESAVAPFVKKQKIGFVVDNLKQVDKLIYSMSPDDYSLFRRNALVISAKLQKGYYTCRVISKIEKEIGKNYKL